MKTITINLYEFAELSAEVKQKVLNNWDDTQGDWWDSVYADADQIGLKITSFDFDRGYNCKGKLTKPLPEVIDLILADPDLTTNTCLVAEKYKKLIEQHEKENNETQEDEEKAQELEESFLAELCGAYFNVLKDEYEYLTSDEYKIETIEANQYTFEADGTMRNI